MKDWDTYEKQIRKVLGACQQKYRWGYLDEEVFHDAAMYGMCEAWGMEALGVSEDQLFYAASSSAVRFAAKEARRLRKAVPMYAYGENGSEYATLDYLTKGARPTQEQECDAHKVAGMIGSDEMTEMIAYGDKKDGGIERMRAERMVRETLGTYTPLAKRRVVS